MNTHAMNTKAGFLKGLLLVSCLIVIVLFFLTMPPTTADAAMQPFGQMLSNADFELGSMTGWSWNGSGSVSVWQNDAQHETPFWGRPGTPYVNYRGTEVIYENNRWNGIIISNANGSIQLFQSVSVTQGQRYRFSAWVYTSGSGVTANLERYSASLGGLVPCASTAEAAYTPVSCEFTASATESMSFILEQGYVSGWARTDDWTLTPISTVPRLVPADTWATLPVRFNTTQYGMRTTMAAWEWNGAMGRTMLQETTDPNQAGIRIVGTYDDASVWFGSTPRWKTNGVKVIELNIYWMDVWDNNYRYGLDARQSTIAHEFGHALGLDHTVRPDGNFYNCELMNGYGGPRSWNCGVYKPTTGDASGMGVIYPTRVFLPFIRR